MHGPMCLQITGGPRGVCKRRVSDCGPQPLHLCAGLSLLEPKQCWAERRGDWRDHADGVR